MSTITIQNSPHFAEWVEDLRTTDAPQVRNALVAQNHDTGAFGFCCLGRGAKCADIPLVTDPVLGFEYRTVTGTYTADTFPPLAFHEWLGVTVSSEANTEDVTIDWPLEDLAGRPEDEPDEGPDFAGYLYTDDEDTATASGLNDKLGLTFPQIADVLAYFGVRGNQ